VKQLLEDINVKKDKSVGDQSDQSVNVSQISEELYGLQVQLEKLGKNENLQTIFDPKYEVKHTVQLQEGLSKKLVSELTKFTAPSEKSSIENKSSGNNVVYELYFTPDQKRLLQIQKVADLEKKLVELEQLVGVSRNEPTQMTGGLLPAVAQLKEKVLLMTDPNQLDAIQRKTKAISQDMDALTEKSKTASATQQIHEKKVHEVFEVMSKWDSVAQSLPALVTRLKSLKLLHEESASFHQNITQLESQQQEIKQLLKSNNELMRQLEKNFGSNVTIIQQNVNALETRFARFAKKIEELGLETF